MSQELPEQHSASGTRLWIFHCLPQGSVRLYVHVETTHKNTPWSTSRGGYKHSLVCLHSPPKRCFNWLTWPLGDTQWFYNTSFSPIFNNLFSLISSSKRTLPFLYPSPLSSPYTSISLNPSPKHKRSFPLPPITQTAFHTPALHSIGQVSGLKHFLSKDYFFRNVQLIVNYPLYWTNISINLHLEMTELFRR